jgi:hypothetical protein
MRGAGLSSTWIAKRCLERCPSALVSVLSAHYKLYWSSSFGKRRTSPGQLAEVSPDP